LADRKNVEDKKEGMKGKERPRPGRRGGLAPKWVGWVCPP